MGIRVICEYGRHCFWIATHAWCPCCQVLCFILQEIATVRREICYIHGWTHTVKILSLLHCVCVHTSHVASVHENLISEYFRPQLESQWLWFNFLDGADDEAKPLLRPSRGARGTAVMVYNKTSFDQILVY